MSVSPAVTKLDALHDELTGLPNRALFRDRVSQAIAATDRSGDQVAILLFKLDGSDQLIGQVAERLRSAVRPGDSVGRLGHDEFGVLLGDSSREEAIIAARRLIAVLDVAVSVGIALADAETDVDTALRHAKTACGSLAGGEGSKG
jgi:diguanylate cyclase (GGDEF)-like protein